MKFIKTIFTEVFLIEPKVFEDARGCFFEDYNKAAFRAHGIAEDFVQDNLSVSAKGVLRGLHYQSPPRAQAKLVRVIRGEAFDVVVDLRAGSKTFGRYESHVLSAENRKLLYIPKGFAHGFLSLRDGTELLYKVSDIYSPANECGVLWNDPAIGIAWPKLDKDFLLSEKDKDHPPLKQAVKG